MNRKRAVSVQFGALAPPIDKQLDEQGFSYNDTECEGWQAIANALTRLVIKSILTWSEVRLARKRLLKRIAKGVTR